MSAIYSGLRLELGYLSARTLKTQASQQRQEPPLVPIPRHFLRVLQFGRRTCAGCGKDVGGFLLRDRNERLDHIGVELDR